MRVLIACEFSGTVRDAFTAMGCRAMSCDLLPSDTDGLHYQGDVLDILGDGWDLMIAHPPCTYLAGSSVQWLSHPDDKHLPFDDRRPHPKYPNRRGDMLDSIKFVLTLWNAPIPRVVIENPVGLLSSRWRKPDQIIQPYMFGDEYTKTTCLWLRGVPPLIPTNVVGKGERVVFASGKSHPKWYADALKLPPSERAKVRNKTFPGIANAMADQWSKLI
jgi:hypothetical protein